MSPNTDYVINMPALRDHQVILQGGRNIYIKGFHTTRGDTNGGPNFMIDGGDNPGTIFMHGGLMDCTGGFESDAIRTRKSVADPSKGAAGERNLVLLETRITAMRGQTNGATDDFGNSSAATHADGIQLAGGLGDLNVAYSTFQSRYANFQLQREQTETSGNFNFITTITRSGSTATLTTAAAHGLVVGDFIQIGKGIGVGATVAPLTGTDCNPSGWNGTYMVATRPSSTQITYDLGDSTPTALTNGGSATWKQSNFNYNCGNFDLDHVNIECQLNMQQYISNGPGETLNAWRIGARPDYKGYEDQTPMTRDGWAGTLTLNEFYIQPLNSSVGSLINPGSAGSVYSGVRATINTVPTPNEISYALWNAVTGKAFVGRPAGGDFAPAWKVGLQYPRVRR
jgi:hypothetical protein